MQIYRISTSDATFQGKIASYPGNLFLTTDKKMKKITSMTVAAALVLSLAGCTSLFDVLNKVANFQFSSDVAYDGQEMVVKRLGTCCYVWEVTSGAQFCDIQVYTGEASKAINGQDSTAVATLSTKSSSNALETVTVRACNRLYPDNESYKAEGILEIHKWELRIKDCATGRDMAEDAVFETEVPYMAYIADLATGEPVNRIVFNLAVGKYRTEEAVDFKFSDTPAGLETLAADGDYPYNPNVAYGFRIDGPVSKSVCTLSASLHSRVSSHSVTFNL